jgi:hypothetical protein
MVNAMNTDCCASEAKPSGRKVRTLTAFVNGRMFREDSLKDLCRSISGAGLAEDRMNVRVFVNKETYPGIELIYMSGTDTWYRYYPEKIFPAHTKEVAGTKGLPKGQALTESQRKLREGADAEAAYRTLGEKKVKR